MNQFAIITPVPDIIDTFVQNSILKKIIERKVIQLKIVNLRDYGLGKHKQIDDAPFGGGGGMVFKPEPLFDAIDASFSWMVTKNNIRVIYPSPVGEEWNQNAAEKLSRNSNIILICGHYKGIDERVIDEYVTDQFSVGDFVMTSGEIPALIILDSVSRLIPGALNNLKSVLNDSFSHQLLDHPHYTNPRKFRNRSVPEVLLNGNHRHIDQWRQEHRESRTIKFRPDLWEKYQKIKESESKMDKIHEVNKKYMKSDIPDFNSGDTVAVDVKVREGNKERVQRFEGIVIARHRKNGLDGTFTVRKVTNGVGVERIFPVQSPLIESINVTRRGKVRRSKLNYLKNVKGAKAARIEEKR